MESSKSGVLEKVKPNLACNSSCFKWFLFIFVWPSVMETFASPAAEKRKLKRKIGCLSTGVCRASTGGTLVVEQGLARKCLGLDYLLDRRTFFFVFEYLFIYQYMYVYGLWLKK